MLRVLWAAGGALVTACGVSAESFVDRYAQGVCEWRVACTPADQALFEGVETIDDCLAIEGPPLLASLEDCTFDADAASDCLDDVDDLACPGAGVPLGSVLPTDCGRVWSDCDATVD